MSNLIAWLKQQGNNAIDMALAGVKTTIIDFGKTCIDFEYAYYDLYMVRQKCLAAGIAFEYESDFLKIAADIEKERQFRLILLKIFYTVSANPKDWNISVHGLSQIEISKVYPGLDYDVDELRLGAVPILVIDALVVLGIIGVISAMLGWLSRIEKMDLIGQLANAYIAEGMTAEEAFKKANKDFDEMNPGFFDKAQSLLKAGALFLTVASLAN